MRRPHSLLVLLFSVLAVAAPRVARADEVPYDREFEGARLRTTRLRTSLSNDPDTIWIGHIADANFIPVDRNRQPVPSSPRDLNGAPTVAGTVPVGGYGPFHVGRGDYLPGIGVRNTLVTPNGQPPSYNGVWDFDHFQAGDDTLQGWWPAVCPGQRHSAANVDDKVRPYGGLDYGNQGNYVIPETQKDGNGRRRTFGVVGYWHRDPGNAAIPAYVDTGSFIPGPNVEWAPLGGSNSAWCGLRAHADLAVQDPATLNYLNQTVLEEIGNNAFHLTGSVNPTGTDKNFPGYGSQWDQMLYRDIPLSGSDALNVSFKYVHALSPASNGFTGDAIGYFWKDPVKPATLNDGNFVSRWDCDTGSLPVPVDSFTVLIGVPVEPKANPFPLNTPNDFTASNGSAFDVYDPQRRWLSEVIASNGPMIELLARTGWSVPGTNTAAGAVLASPPGTVSFSANVPNAGVLAAIISASNTAGFGGRVRIVFRVKTNRGNDDEDYGGGFNAGTFTSRTCGAAIVDDVDVRINGGGSNAIPDGDFEAVNAIDNTLVTVDGCGVVNGSTSVTSAGGFGSVAVGDHVYGQNIPAGTTVAAKADDSNLTLSSAAVNTNAGARVWFNTRSALEAWKSTGKPPKVFFHIHSVDQGVAGALNWADPCSPPDFFAPSAPNRACNMIHNVLTGGDHDNGERAAGDFGTGTTNGNYNMRDIEKYAYTPTIILTTDGVPTHYNAMGISSDIIANFTDLNIYSDIHTAGFLGTGAAGNGAGRNFGVSSYPARQANGASCWGEFRSSTSFFFNTTLTCIPQSFALWSAGYVATSNLSGIPDSLRVVAYIEDRCYGNGIPISRCAGGTPQLPTMTGQYMDNFAFEIEKARPVVGLFHNPWMMLQDAFPQYVSNMSPMTMKTDFTAAAFDTATALVKSAFNRAQNNGLARISVLGDSGQVSTGAAPSLQLDMVFRIYPGPGNYVTDGVRSSGLRKVPTSATKTDDEPLASSSNFWESYMADNGANGTGGNGANGPGHPRLDGTYGAGTVDNPRVWDVNTWNSARMDTLEQNLWPNTASSPNLAQNSGGNDWQTTYHEDDPKYTTLGIARNRCFMVSPTGTTTCTTKTPSSVSVCNVICGTATGTGAYPNAYPPTWTTGAGGADNTELNNGTPVSYGSWGKTYEGTKIIPDGLLTAGSTVQYFYRRYPGLSAAVDLLPDTTQIFSGLNASDGGRWYTMAVLPDRWKGFGSGMACMLVVDNQDLGGDEFFWVSAADSIGLTSGAKRGALSGWYAAGGVNTPGTFDQATLIASNGGQQGTLYDYYNVRAGGSLTTSAGWLSNRYATQPVAAGLTDKKQSSTGIWDELLASSAVGYKALVYLTGTATSTNFGRVIDRTDDDTGMLNRYALTPANGTRAIWVWGAGFGENMSAVTGGPTWLNTFFGASLKNKAYRAYSGHLTQVAHAWATPGGAFDLASNRSAIDFGLHDGCGLESDVLDVTGPGVASTYYENVGSLGPYIGSVYAPSGGGRQQITLWDGSRPQRMGSFASVLPLGRQGFQYFVIKGLSITAGLVSCAPYASPVGVGNGPQSGAGSAFVNFLRLRSSNPMRSGEARLAFGLARTEKVELRVYDVTGRVVKTVANRIFAGGQEHVVTWDGSDESGNKVRSGVYFYQLRTATWTSQKKLTLLSQ